MAAHGSDPLQGIKDLLLFPVPRSGSRAGLGLVADLGLFGDVILSWEKPACHREIQSPILRLSLIDKAQSR